MHWLWMSLYHALAMLWETFWALVMGFTISALLQVFVRKEQMERLFGRAGLREVALATGFGAASSSCSYAAVAAGRSAFRKGAAMIPALAFMFASTNLVIELGAVLWLLMGWVFVLAEVVGSFVLIGVMWILMKLFFPKKLEEDARHHSAEVETSDSCGHSGHEHEHDHEHDHEQEHEQEKEAGGGKWSAAASAFVMDWLMLWKEILGGFLIAGFLAVLMPANWWQAFFLKNGPAALQLIENALVGPLIAVTSFVCSVGNIPLASLLWAHGISFGGVISFIYADLLVLPIVLIYIKYFGKRAATRIVLIFYIAMVTAGIFVDLLFSFTGLIPSGPRPASAVEQAHFSWNYTTWLDLVALVVAGFFVFLHRRSGREGGHCHHS